jgi:hypothetical protein
LNSFLFRSGGLGTYKINTTLTEKFENLASVLYFKQGRSNRYTSTQFKALWLSFNYLID